VLAALRQVPGMRLGWRSDRVNQRAIHDHIRMTGRLRRQRCPCRDGLRAATTAMPLSLARADIRASSRNQRSTSTACWQGPSSRAGPCGYPPQPLGVQQRGVLGYLQDGGVCDTHQARTPYEVDLESIFGMDAAQTGASTPSQPDEVGIDVVALPALYDGRHPWTAIGNPGPHEVPV